ncbi:hypothetical protein Tco_0467989, partial [Tanacetum coccineum]
GKLQKLEELKISSCRSLREIFEIRRVNKNGSDSANVGDGIGDYSFSGMNIQVHKFGLCLN